MIRRLVTALAVMIAVGLLCLLAAAVLHALTGVPIAATIGNFLAAWAWVIGILAGIFQFVGKGRFVL